MVRPELVLINGLIVTMEEDPQQVEALAIGGGKILALGSTAEIEKLNQEGRVIDLQGATVVPGLTDAHVHFIATGLNMLGVLLNDTNSVEEVLERVWEQAQQAGPGKLIMASGLDTNRFAIERFPTRQELDQVAPENLVFINRVDSHSCVVNTRLLEELDLPEGLAGVELGADGTPTGFMRKRANSFVRNQVLDMVPEVMRIAAAQVVAEAAIRAGVTTVHALEGGALFNDKDVEALLEVQDELPVHLVIWHQTMDVEKAKSLGIDRVGGCITLDGSFTSRTAALYEDYSDDPGNNGLLYFDQETINQFIENGQRAGVQLSVHVLAERAIDQILDAYEGARQKYPRPEARHRLEHFELPTIEQIQRATEMGIIFSMQPAFEYFWGGNGMYGARLGAERAARSNPFRTILQAGGRIVGGSDSDVTPINPLVGIQGAMTHSNPAERLDAREALKLYTINPAFSVYEEHERGTIQVGKYADLTVLDQNPLITHPEEMDQIRVKMTIVEGKVVYQQE